jgi:phospholipid/cholesterol/gamma-HCH transport system substrate-binding protein
MKQGKLELSVGIFVLLGVAAVAYLTVKLGAGSLVGGNTYLVEARFANVGGLHTGSSVLVAGVTVGRVDHVRVDPRTTAPSQRFASWPGCDFRPIPWPPSKRLD